MLKRKMYNTLVQWKASGTHKAFLLFGARQTGKTYLIQQFGHECFQSVMALNLLENPAAAKTLQAATDTTDFLNRLSLLTQARLVPGDTLVFFDEVQESPDVLTRFKFLVEDGRVAVVASGSMLGVTLKGLRSFPVGYVQIEDLFPLDLEEFGWAMGVSPEIFNQIREAYAHAQPLDDALHSRLIELFRYYLAVGGMPEVVQTFVDTGRDIGAAREIAQNVTEQYRFDISKYATNRASVIRLAFDAIPSQLSKENKRFQLKTVQQKASYARLEDDFAWLIDAAVALPVYRVTEPKRPLRGSEERNCFKLYASDTGLLLSSYSQQSTLDVLSGASSANFGAVYENAVAQALRTGTDMLAYYRNSKKGEVDFLVETDHGDVLPLEVKSGKDYRIHVALSNLLKTAEYDIERACVLSEANLSQKMLHGKPVTYLPLYMAFCVAEHLSPSTRSLKLPPIDFEFIV